MDIFRNMQIFVEVAREKSFRGAADNLGIPNSTVSRRIAELEREVLGKKRRRVPKKAPARAKKKSRTTAR